MKKGITVWFTGLSGSGKTTITKHIEKIMKKRGHKVERLDGDTVRDSLTEDLGFSKEDRNTNNRRITFVAKLLSRNKVLALVAAISPYKEAREFARSQIDNFLEVYVKCPIKVCEERDVKGLYKQARKGEIDNFTGISDPYEEPQDPDITLETHKENPIESAMKVIRKIEELEYVCSENKIKTAETYSKEDEEKIEKRLKDLGYI